MKITEKKERNFFMKIKLKLLECSHESKYGVDVYTRLVKKNESVSDVIEEIKSECDYDENRYNEYFDYNERILEIDTDEYDIKGS